MPNFQQTADIHRLDRYELPKMQCACIALAKMFRGCLNQLCTFPSGHRANIHDQCGHRKVVCLFKQETPEGVRWPLWKRGWNPMTRHRNTANSQPVTYIGTQPQ